MSENTEHIDLLLNELDTRANFLMKLRSHGVVSADMPLTPGPITGIYGDARDGKRRIMEQIADAAEAAGLTVYGTFTLGEVLGDDYLDDPAND